MSKLPRLTSCAIKNHSLVKICRVAETRAQQLPQMQTQPEHLLTAVDTVDAETTEMAGHIVKRSAVATGADGGQAACPKVVDDCENSL